MLSNLTDVDLRLLRLFHTVVRCGGFTAAQTELNMSQSNISMQIANLESRLGYRLCERGKGGFRLTAKGAAIIEASRRLFDSIGFFVDQARSLSGRLVGALNVGIADTIVTLDQTLIGSAIARFHQRQQDVHLNLHANAPTELELAVTDGTIELAISYFSRHRETFDYLPLYEEQIGLICGVKHPLWSMPSPNLADLRNARWVEHGFLPDHVVLPLRPDRPRATANHMEAVAQLILAGTHIGYLPLHYAEFWIERGRMKRLMPDALTYAVKHSMITYAGRPLTEAARAFIDDLRHVHGMAPLS